MKIAIMEMRRSINATSKATSGSNIVGRLTAAIKPAEFTSPRSPPVPHFRNERRSRLFLHILDAGKDDALGAFPRVAEIEFVLRQEHRIAIDVVGNAGAVGRDERIELPAVIGGNPPRQMKLADLEFHRQRELGI